MSSNKIGLIPLTAIVVGSQVGSGVFMLPQMLAPYGVYAILGWLTSGFGALCLAMVFVGLVKRYPKNGGPHAYADVAFGSTTAFFTGWAYWLSCTLGSATVIAATVNYLTPIIGDLSPLQFAGAEIVFLIIISAVNLRGVHSAGNVETILGLVKLIVLFLLPMLGLYYFSGQNIQISPSLSGTSNLMLIGKAASLTLWAFLGVEAATTPAGSVENPTFTIPAALIIGTSCVAFLYVLNSISLMGLIPHESLINTHTPYVLATQLIFGGNWHLIIAMFSAIVCLSNLNAWVLAGGQIASGIAEDGLLPELFKKKNANGAPYWSIFLGCLVVVPVVLFTIDDNVSKQINIIIDLAVQASLMIYLICIASYFIILKREGKAWWHFEQIIAVIACLFCVVMLGTSDIKTLLYSSLFFASGLPIHLYWKRCGAIKPSL